MSDFSLTSYDDKKEDDAAKKDPTQLGDIYLTKSSHRDPEKHKVGDSLPSELLAYGEGTSSLTPDPAGNNPVMLRSRQIILGNNAVQSITQASAQLANLTCSVTCPTDAGSGSFVRVTYSVLFAVTSAGRQAGATYNNEVYCRLYVNGVGLAGSLRRWKCGDASNAFNHDASYTAISIFPVGINPGQTLNIQVKVFCYDTVATPDYFYQANAYGDDCNLQTELYY